MLLYFLACASNAAEVAPEEAPEPAAQTVAYPDCAGSCSLPGGYTDTDQLSESAFLGWLMQWAEEPVGAPTLALETLLFHGHRSEELLAVHGHRLDAEHLDFLTRELSRHTVRMEMRLVDEHGAIRGTLDSGMFPLKEKQHIAFADTGSLGWLETGGKVKRVGLEHVWSRW